MKPKKDSEVKFVIAFFVLTGIGLLIALASAILFALGNDCAGAINIVATVVSILLSAVSLGYTYVSGIQTLRTIRDLKRQNDALVNKLTAEGSKDNYDESNAESAFR